MKISRVFDLFAHPIYGNGDYPQELKDQVLKKSMEQNLTSSHLPEFTEAEKRMINGNPFLHKDTSTTGMTFAISVKGMWQW